ncbi:ATP-binding protein [Paenibacillus sp. L3-i20]|uniref:ATP-binding protein n=1 Tax=Paenibacillus sp. L3-i20 TaxID=2905833 RepID=UPI001EDCE6DA|nr:ATP-binding protein [Paenibacillus sp. L3-i20]GKU77957.1 hypothetical protein L3i20_v223540 [Paenibacillus sp. L3-i20]
MGNSILYGNPYYLMLSLIIMCYAAFTMISMSEHISPQRPLSSINWLFGASLVFSLGLWTIHVVSLITSEYMLVVDWSLIGNFALSAVAIFGCLNIHYRKLFKPRLRVWICALIVACTTGLLHSLPIASNIIQAYSVRSLPFTLSIVISFFGAYIGFLLLAHRPSHYKMICSIIFGLTSIGTDQLGIRALIVEYDAFLTSDLLHDYLLLLAFILCISTFIISSFSLISWLSVKKYTLIDERYKLLVENSMDTIALIKQGKWEYLNPSGYQLFEVDNEKDFIGSSVYDLLSEDHHIAMKELLETDPAIDDCPAKPIELKWKTTSGKLLHTEIVRVRTMLFGMPIDEVIIRDISERRKNEELLLNAEKLSIAGQLAAGIAHEIRNPLTSLKGFMQLMSTGRIHNSRYYAIMNSELVRIESIISELLMLSKPQVYEYIHIDLCQLMNGMIDELSSTAQLYNVKLVQNTYNHPVWVEGVENQLKQVFINVMKNAIESMEEGGTVHIKLSMEENNLISVTIQDEGSGIPEEQLTRIGQPFYTTKDKGTGLGLMVTYKIIDNHKGSIEAESELGVGTTFTIRLPYRSPKAMKLAVLNRHV